MSSEIISLKSGLDQLERSESMLAKSIGCYIEALKGVEVHIFRPFADKTGQQPVTLEANRRRLKAEPTEPALEDARRTLDLSLRSTSDKLQQQLAGAVELTEVLGILAETTQNLQRKGVARESRVLTFASDLEATAKMESVNALRERIQTQVQRLTAIVSEMREENRQVIAELEREMKSYRQKLDEARQAANVDALTGLDNRRMLQKRVDEHVRAGLPFCLVLLDLDKVKAVNDQHGYSAGDEFLRLFSARLRKQLRGDDVPTRWGGDQFVVILPCSLREGMLRAQSLEQSLCGVYTLQLKDRVVRVNASLTVGVAEHQPGESSEHLLSRADSLLSQRQPHAAQSHPSEPLTAGERRARPRN